MSVDEFEFENRVNRLRNMIEEIVGLLGEVQETMLTISSRPLSFAPPSSAPVPPLPGGGALVVSAPAADVAAVADDTPHPVVVLGDLADMVRKGLRFEGVDARSVEREPLASSSAFLLEHLRWVVARPEGADVVEARLTDCRHHLRVLVGDVEPPALPSTEEVVEMMRDRVAAAPSAYSMTPAEADFVWPGIHDRIRKAKSRGTWTHEPDEKGRYSCTVLLGYATDRRARATRAGSSGDQGARMSH